MDKNSLLLSFYSGRAINHSAFDKYFSPNGMSKTEYTHEILDECDYVKYELIAEIENDNVAFVDVSKIEDLNTGHGRPQSIERGLTSSEWKHAYQVFDECFPDKNADELNKVITEALEKNSSYSGYTIKKELKNDIAFETLDGNIVKLPKKRISQAIVYSHENLDILFKPEITQEFSECLGKSRFEPLFAVISTINPETYPNYKNLLGKYRFNELIRAIEKEDLILCKSYEDILKNSEINIGVIGNAVFKADNSIITDWFFETVPDGSCSMNGMLSEAIKRNDSTTIARIIKKRLFDSSVDEKSWQSPMAAALDKPAFIPLLLKNGFRLTSDKYFSTLSLDEIKNNLQFNIRFGRPVIDRIIAEKRFDILEIIETAAPQYCSREDLISSYIDTNDYDRFEKSVNRGWFSKTNYSYIEALFDRAYDLGERWADLIITSGIDVNQNGGRLLKNAYGKKKFDLVFYLLENGADPCIRNDCAYTFFEIVAKLYTDPGTVERKNQERLCKLLLDLDVDPIMESRSTPGIFCYLLNLSQEFKLYLIEWLAKHNRINAYECQNNRNISKHRLLYHILDPYSPKKYDSLVLRKMLEHGAEVDVATESGDTLFVQACSICDLEDLQLLVQHGANINELDKISHTNGLFKAVWHKQTNDVIWFLISLGLDVNSIKPESKSNNGYYYETRGYPAQSVLDIAIENGNNETIELLKQHGAKTAKEIKE